MSLRTCRGLLLLATVALSRCQDHEILEAPVNTSAPLGTNATFNCAVRGETLLWRVNNHDLKTDYYINLANMNGIFIGPSSQSEHANQSSLIVLASTDINNTFKFACVADDGVRHENMISATVYLAVFGEPLAPTQASLTADTLHQLTLDWGPPFTLPGEMVTYTVLIKNLNTSGTEMVEGLNTTSYTHSLTEEEAALCHTYQFSVSSENAVGLSENSTTAVGVHPSVPDKVGSIRTIVSFTEDLSVTLFFETPNTCFPLNYSVQLSTGTASFTKGSFLYSGNGTEHIVLTEVDENTKYTARVLAQNKDNFSSLSEEISFYTTDVQSASVEQLLNGSLLLKCIFGEGSSALGCRLTIILGPRVSISVRVYRKNDSSLEAVEYYHNMAVGDTPSSAMVNDIEATGDMGGFGPPVQLQLLPSSSGTPTPTRSPSRSEEQNMVVIISISVGAGAVLVLACIVSVLVLCFIQRRLKTKGTAMGCRPTAVFPIYEDVDMTINPRYESHRLTGHCLTLPPSLPNDGVRNPLYSPAEEKIANTSVGMYVYAECGKPPPVPEETYEQMKPGVSVRVEDNIISTADNVCYTSHDD